MNILAIDSATGIELVSVLSKDVISDKTSLAAKSHSVTLFDNIDRALSELNLTIRDIDLIGTGIGPGSFTGIRIAVTTTRMLAQLLRVPLVGIKTHLIYASSLKTDENDNIIIAFDAKKGKIFGAVYRKDKDCLAAIEVLSPGDYQVNSLINSIDQRYKTILIGDGVEKYYGEFSAGIGEHIFFPDFVPSGETACRLIKKIYQDSPEKFNSINQTVPFYARESDAEIMKEIGLSNKKRGD